MAANKGGRVKSDRVEQEWFKKRRKVNRRRTQLQKNSRKKNRGK